MKNIILSLAIIVSSLFSQNAYDVLRPFWGFEHSQILSNSIGGATVASGYITPGLSSNPANLAATQFGYMQINFSNSEFSSISSNISNTGFNGFDYVQPVPVHRGRLVFSIGGHKQIDYMSASENSSYDFSEKGKLSSYHIAGAVEFAKNLYLGADFKLLSGGDEMTMSNNDQTYYFKPRYSGSSFTVGLLHVLSKNLQYGVSIDMPTSLNVEELYTESDHVNGDLSFSETYNYNVKKPLTFHGGAAILLKSVNFFYELEYTDWRSLEFSSDDIYEADLELPASVVINNEIRETFSSTTSHHFGFAMRVPVLPVHLFAGYQILPVPFSNQYDNNLRESFSFGCSIAIKKNVTLQASYDNYMWNYDGSPENFDKVSIGVSLHEIPGL